MSKVMLSQGSVKFLNPEQEKRDLIELGRVYFSFLYIAKVGVHIRVGHRVCDMGSLYLPITSSCGEKEKGDRART